MKQIAVLGLGRFGRSLAKSLEDMGHEVLGVDTSEEIVDEMSEVLTNAVQANVQEENALRQLGITNFDVVVVSIGGDIQASIMTTMLLKEMGVPYIVCKVTTDLHAKIVSKLGADRVIFPERDMGIRLARSIANSDILEFIELSSEHSMLEIHTPQDWAEHTIIESNVRARYGIYIVAIRRGDEMIVTPGPSETLHKGDILIVIGSNDQLEKLDSKA